MLGGLFGNGFGGDLVADLFYEELAGRQQAVGATQYTGDYNGPIWKQSNYDNGEVIDVEDREVVPKERRIE